MNRPLRFTLIWASFAAAFAVFAPLASAGVGTYYAASNGSGTTCGEKSPCSLTEAVAKAVNEDSVSLAPGKYVLPGGGLGIGKEIDIGGQVGAEAATIIDTTAGNVHVNTVAKPTLHDMRIEGAGGLVLSSGTAERLFVSYTGPSSSGCSLDIGVVMLDSVCWAHDGGSGSDGIEAAASGVAGTVVLRNVTALATNSGGDGLRAQATGSLSKLVVEGTDVIARADHHPDVAVELNGGGFPVAEVKLANSSYARVEGELAPFGTVTPPGTNGNQIAAPSFVSAAAGDFREAPGSPTIDAGVNDPLNGPFDLDGGPRSLPACLGGSAITDIGAFELVPVSCLGPPGPPAVVSPPLPSEIGIGKLKLNKKKGTGILLVTVSGPGDLTLTGKDVAKSSRSSHGSEVLKLAVKPVGKAKKHLRESGKAKLSLKLTFAPTAGPALTKATKASLVEKGS